MKLPYHLHMRTIVRFVGMLTALGLWSAGPSMADTAWTPVMLTDKGLFYYAPQSVSVVGRISRVRSMMDYKAPQESGEGQHYLSTINDIQINCRSREARITHTSYHSQPKGGGQEIRKEGMLRDWLDILPDTVIDRIAKRIC